MEAEHVVLRRSEFLDHRGYPMSSGGGKNGGQHPSKSAWEEAQRRVRDRNDEARRAGRQERDEREQRAAANQHARDVRNHVDR
jgi:hypothetical protein